MAPPKANDRSSSKSQKQSSIASFFTPKTKAAGSSPRKSAKSPLAVQKAKEKPVVVIPSNPDEHPTPPPAKKVRIYATAGKKVSVRSPPNQAGEEDPRTPHTPSLQDAGDVYEGSKDSSRSGGQPSTTSKQPDGLSTNPQALVGKALQILWPDDDLWYEGKVISYNRRKGQHVVLYTDGEEETLDLSKEKVKWLAQTPDKTDEGKSPGAVKSIKAKGSKETGWPEAGKGSSIKRKRKVVYIEESEPEQESDGGDDSEDEDWAKLEDASTLEEMDDVEEDLEEEVDSEGDEEEAGKARKKSSREGRNGGKTSPSKGNSVHRKGRLVKKRAVEQTTPDQALPENQLEDLMEVDEQVPDAKEPKITAAPAGKSGQKSWPGEATMARKLKLDSATMKLFKSSSSNGESSAPQMSGGKSAASGGSLDPQIKGEVAERFGGRAEEKFPFLHPKNRRDAKMRRAGDEGYDERTLHIPERSLKELTGGQRQWWQFKAQHMDKVLLFKMGKFYEMFEMDAHIGAQDLDLQYMKGEQPHCGFPEKNYADNAERLARKGYRVLVVEQTETPEQLEQRRKETGSKDKVVKRDICAILTKGTLVDGEMLGASPEAAYLLAVMEVRPSQDQLLLEKQGAAVVGLCAVDTAAGRFLVGEFLDDSARTRLRSVLSELRPVELVKPAGELSEAAERALRDQTRQALVNNLNPGKEFWDSETSIAEIGKYFGQGKDASSMASRKRWPSVLRHLAEAGHAGRAALSAFGGCLFYLRQALLDKSLMALKRVELLPGSDFLGFSGREANEEQDGEQERASENEGSGEAWEEVEDREPKMALDSAALENLEILENGVDGGQSGTLVSLLDHCVTPFGKRLLKEWLVRPLMRVEAIVQRQDALIDLKGVAAEALGAARKLLAGAPDMERILARLHTSSAAGGGSGRHAVNVVLYEDAALKHLKEFTSALKGCRAMAQALAAFASCRDKLTSTRLKWLLTPNEGFPDLTAQIAHFEKAFDWTKAEETGRIVPCPGVDAQFDSVAAAVKEVEAELEAYLREQRKLLGNPPEMAYLTVGKDPYQMEVPERLHSRVPEEYELKTQRKGFRRYWTPTIRELLARLTSANEERETALRGILVALRSTFCAHLRRWSAAVRAVAELDVLGSLAMASTYAEGPLCRPVFAPPQIAQSQTASDPAATEPVPYLKARALRHPTVGPTVAGGGAFVPNDVALGGEGGPHLMLLTGPNMGGKSTQLRQVCLAVIMAQVGADVPAESLSLTPVDRVFVRMGARDHIMAGQSTFLVELSETATMLRSATRHSLVALDELGRGTATSDGQAIAHAVLRHLAHETRCLGMFSTHYHRLADEHAHDPTVALRHMGCKVGATPEGMEEVTFLYKLAEGACPKSYGVNVARLAGMPEAVLKRAASRAAEMETEEEAQPGEADPEGGTSGEGGRAPANGTTDIGGEAVGDCHGSKLRELQQLVQSIGKIVVQKDVVVGRTFEEGGEAHGEVLSLWAQAKKWAELLEEECEMEGVA